MLTLESFEEAAAKVKEVTQETKLIYSSYFSDMTGNKVYLKPENMQRTGAYKVRGAYYKISTLSDEERNKGLITASAGNHAQGVAYAAHKYGVKAVIVMPTTTPLIKVERTKSYGAEVILHGDVYDEACAHALALGYLYKKGSACYNRQAPYGCAMAKNYSASSPFSSRQAFMDRLMRLRSKSTAVSLTRTSSPTFSTSETLFTRSLLISLI